jgi:TRAP transporter TAXI family solute receptor
MYTRKAFFISFLVVALFAGGAAAGERPKPLTEPVSLKIVTPPAVTATYPAVVFITEIIKKALPPGSTILTIPAPGRGAMEMVGIGKADMNISTQAYIQMAALRGDARFGFKKAYPGVKGIAQLTHYGQMSIFQFIVTKETGLTSLEEIKARKYPLRLATSIYGSVTEQAMKMMLSSHGITYDDIRSWGGKVDHIGWRETVDAAKEGRINAMGGGLHYNYPYIVELAVTKPVTVLSHSDEVIEKLVKDYPGLERHTIPASALKDYRGVEKDVNTVASGHLIVVRPGLPDEVVYAITKIIVENHEIIAKQFAAHKYFAPEMAVRLSGFPLHPQAALYYKEIGVLK